MAAGDEVPPALVRAHARAFGDAYGPDSWEAAAAPVVGDPDFARFSPDAQDRILRRLVGDGGARWWYRRRAREATAEPGPPNETDVAAAILGLGR